MIFDDSHAWRGPTFPYDSPREWQAEALPGALQALASGSRGIVRAIMGAGKAAEIAEIVYCSRPDPGETIVISAPIIRLVDQLHATISARVGDRFVGRYYTHEKTTTTPIVIACVDSLPGLAAELDRRGQTVAAWIADEVHRTETETVAAFVDRAGPPRCIGFTATPYKGKGGLVSWDEVVYEYGVGRALSDGVIVPWSLRHYTGPEVAEDIAMLKLAEKGATNGPGVINASTIDDADTFSELCHEYGLAAEPVHSGRTTAQNDRALERLHAGELDAVVHVSMLQEGVDLPWLRWLLMRRDTKSRVRFAQEVGRVLRSHPGKSEAIIFDPHDLFGTHKLSLGAILSGGSDSDAIEDEKTFVEEAADETLELFEALPDDMPEEEKVLAGLDPVESYLRCLVVALDAEGILDQKVASRRMRRDAATDAQIRYARQLRGVINCRVVPNLPDRHREILWFAMRESWRLNKGAVSDLISILVGLRNTKRWPGLAEEMAGNAGSGV